MRARTLGLKRGENGLELDRSLVRTTRSSAGGTPHQRALGDDEQKPELAGSAHDLPFLLEVLRRPEADGVEGPPTGAGSAGDIGPWPAKIARDRAFTPAAAFANRAVGLDEQVARSRSAIDTSAAGADPVDGPGYHWW